MPVCILYIRGQVIESRIQPQQSAKRQDSVRHDYNISVSSCKECCMPFSTSTLDAAATACIAKCRMHCDTTRLHEGVTGHPLFNAGRRTPLRISSKTRFRMRGKSAAGAAWGLAAGRHRVDMIPTADAHSS